MSNDRLKGYNRAERAHELAEALEEANPTGRVLGEDERAIIREHQTPADTRPILDLTYVSGRLSIGVVELDGDGYAVRAAVLATQEPHVVDRVFLRRFDDMARLMGDNVQIRKDLWLTEDEAAEEADHRNSDDPELSDTNQAWQTAYVNDGTGDGFWTVTLENVNV